MGYVRKAAQGGLWLGGFRFLTQLVTWVITIFVARILYPSDYGLIAMAAFITNFIELFSEMGIGAAIIQKDNVTHEERSSLHWFSVFMGLCLSLICFAASYPAAWIFHESRVIPVIQLISILFIIGSFMIVPNNILIKNCEFKKVGGISFIGSVTSSISMYFMAIKGFGVYTLVFGGIILRITLLILTLKAANWKPAYIYQFRMVKPFLKYGIHVAGSRSLYNGLETGDKFIVGKIFNATLLGYYSFAMTLSKMPNDKMFSIIHQVSFPVFSKYKNEAEQLNDLYMRITKYIVLFVAPIYIGGIVFGGDIIRAFLGTKWESIIPMFKYMCVGQLVFAIGGLNSSIHNAQGRANWVLYYSAVTIVLILGSLFISAILGFNYLVIPWGFIFPAICIIWSYITIKKLGIAVSYYYKSILYALLPTMFMVFGILFFQEYIFIDYYWMHKSNNIIVIQELITGIILYSICVYAYDKNIIIDIKKLKG